MIVDLVVEHDLDIAMKAGGMLDLGTLGGNTSHAFGLNTPSAGQRLLVVGDAQNPAGKTTATYWYYNVASGVASAGVALSTADDMQSTAWGANESEQIAGGSYTKVTVGGVTTYRVKLDTGATLRASMANTARLDMDAYNASQRVTAWFTPDDCVVLEQ